MKHFVRFSGLTLMVIGVMVPTAAFAAEETTVTNEDLLSITERAEDTISDNIPQGVKDFFNRNFAAVERFRLGQVAIATAHRDELAAQMETYNDEPESTSEEMGESVPSDAPTQTTIKYYAYKYYAMFVSSAIVFYLVGGFIIVYIIGKLFNRARRRGGE